MTTKITPAVRSLVRSMLSSSFDLDTLVIHRDGTYSAKHDQNVTLRYDAMRYLVGHVDDLLAQKAEADAQAAYDAARGL